MYLVTLIFLCVSVFCHNFSELKKMSHSDSLEKFTVGSFGCIFEAVSLHRSELVVFDRVINYKYVISESCHSVSVW